MSEQLDRPKLTRAILRSHDIYYHEKVYVRNGTTPMLSMPDHVNMLREALLDFSGIQILDSWKKILKKEEVDLRATHQRRGIDASDWDLQPPTSAYVVEEELRLSRCDWTEEIQRLQDNFYKSKRIATSARKLGYDSESGWMDFLRAKFFKRFERQQNGDDDDDYVQFDEFSLEENVLWDESKRAYQWEENFTPGIRERTGPKPDLSYGFKASQLNNNQRGFEGMHYFRNLSFDVLGELRARTPAIRSTVTAGLSKWHWWRAENRNERNGNLYPGKLLTPDYLCFPWAVVEAKHAQGKMSAEEYCQCQLANATACAYDLQEKLIRSVDDSCPVDPIIGFTCIGPRVRLWLTYRGDDSKMHMVCVWATSLDGTWGALCLTEVVAYMRVWASRILRGKIVQYIDWAYRIDASTAPNTMHNVGKGLGAQVVDSTAGTSSTERTSNGSTEDTSTRGGLSGKGVTMQATGTTLTPAEPNSKRKIQVKLPPAPDSKSTATNKLSGSEIPRRVARGTSDTFINQQAVNASSTSRTQNAGPSKTSAAGGRTTPLNGFDTVPASTPGSSQSSKTANSPVSTCPRSPVNTPATSVFNTPLGNVPSTAGGFTTFQFGSTAVSNSSTHTRETIPIRKKSISTLPEGSANTTSNASSSSWKPLLPRLFEFTGLSPPLPRPIKPVPPTAALTGTTPQHELAPTPPTLPLNASNATSTSPTFVVSGLPLNNFLFNPQYSTLSPPQQPLRSSRSDTNLAAKAQSSASAPNYTIFDKLAQKPTTDTLTSAPLRGTPGQAKVKALLDLPQSVSYPLLPTHARLFSSDGGKKGGYGELRQRAVSDAGGRAGAAQTL